MTTFTIDMPLKMKKTHFASPLEAIFFLSQIGLKKPVLPSSVAKKSISPIKKTSLEKAMEEYHKGETYDKKDLQMLMKKR